MNSGTMNTRGAGNFRQNLFDLRLLFPKRLADVGKDFPPAQFRRVLEDRRGGILVLRRAVAQHHQRGIGKIVTVHGARLAHASAIRKPDWNSFFAGARSIAPRFYGGWRFRHSRSNAPRSASSDHELNLPSKPEVESRRSVVGESEPD